jgi:large subunit ribosomal protein L23
VNAKTVSETKQAPEKKKAEKKPQAAATTGRRFAVDRLMKVVLAPVVSEKSTFVADKNRQYVFRVADDATKPQIRAAIELMFKTKVEGVTVLNVKGKERRFGRTIGRKRSWKKAYVRLAEGQEINFAATQ